MEPINTYKLWFHLSKSLLPDLIKFFVVHGFLTIFRIFCFVLFDFIVNWFLDLKKNRIFTKLNLEMFSRKIYYTFSANFRR